ncbi:hypothetical protein NliqN6_2510 [Naganishia liquefaciens]|uniref:Claudin family protein n=1 Tax=Naganishia liquefaciens TaxID=104408 RepID=A0A8H3YEC0_9TREE|nr:hypothetical protein NliqN6_2510 [Naganishia liquefaciens]
MRGEYCVAGASFFTFVSVVLMVFAMIGQVNPGTLTKDIYMIKVDMAAYGAGLQGATNTSVGGLYDTKAKDALGTKLGLRQNYRWNYLGSCAYVNGGDGICNSTSFGHAFTPLAAILSDTPAKFSIQTEAIIPKSTFKDDSYNKSLSRVAFWTAFIGGCAALVALVAGLIPNRLTYLVAAVGTIVSAIGLCIGAAVWTVLINKNNFLNIVKVQGGRSLGINVTAGPSLYLTWVAFACSALSVFPYVVAACTYRKY